MCLPSALNSMVSRDTDSAYAYMTCLCLYDMDQNISFLAQMPCDAFAILYL